MHAILRSYNNLGICDLIDGLNASGQIDTFIVVVDAARDSANTPALLRTLEHSNRIRTVALDDYGWSKGLNAGISALPPLKDRDELLMIISNEVQITHAEIQFLVTAASNNSASCGYALFAGWEEPTYMLPRNTCIVWKRRVFQQVGIFNESFDKETGTGTGMEDYEMVLRAFQKMQLLPCLGPANVTLNRTPHLDLQEKLAWETEGVRIIENSFPRELVTRLRSHIESQNNIKISRKVS